MSMADSTACSASSEYGGRRSRYGSRAADGAIEYSTGELDIFPGGALPGGIPQQRGGVIRHDERHPVEAMNLSPELPNGKLRVEKSLRGERTERDENLRPNQLDLTYQVRATGGNLFGTRVSVSGRPVLEHVDDENIFPREFDCGENLLEQLSGLTDERPPGLVFRGPRRLSDEHEVRFGISFAGHRVLCRCVQRTSRTRRDRLCDRIQRIERRAAGTEQLVRRRAHHDAARGELTGDFGCRCGDSRSRSCRRLRNALRWPRASRAQCFTPIVA